MTQLTQTAARILLVSALSLGAGCVTSKPAMDSEVTPDITGHSGPLVAQQAERLVDGMAQSAPDEDAFVDLINTIGSLSKTPLYLDNKIDLLIDGPATYAAMERAIASASRYVHVETYIFANDKVGQKFADALMEKARQGVKVRLIFDSIGSFSSGDAFFERMVEAGVEVFEFNDINPLDGGNPLDANTRDHRKILIVDGEIAFTGGVNFSKTYSSRPGQQNEADLLEDGWRDTHVAVYGPAVAGLESVFKENWRAHGGAIDAAEVGSQDGSKTGSDTIAVLSAKGGNDIESPIYHAYLQAIRLANERVWITQAYFVPDDKLLSELTLAARRGVDVRVIVPGQSDSRLVMGVSRSHYGDLLKSGVRIYETTSSMLHAKTAVVDGTWATVGSSNLDTRSELHNDEVNVVVFGTDFAQQMEAQFLADIDTCRSVSLAEWKKRPLRSKLFELISRPLAYWL